MSIEEAKRLLPLPTLIHRLGYAHHAKKRAFCPFHDDQRTSFSLYRDDKSEWRFKCHAGCGGGDEIDFLQLAEKLSKKDAIKRFLELADGTNSTSHKPFVAARVVEPAKEVEATDNPTATPKAFDWQECVDPFKEPDLFRLTVERGYSRDFVSWLKENGLIGIYDGCFAFPVHDNAGNVVAAHYQLKDGSWRYYPQGTKARPLVIGKVDASDPIHVFESQWDAFSLMDKLGVKSGVIITRGALNGKLVKGLILDGDTVYAWKQNDCLKNGKRAGDGWLKDVVQYAGTKVLCPKTLEQFKDLNDWTISGATQKDLLGAMTKAREAEKEEEKHQQPKPETPRVEGYDVEPVEADEETIARLATLHVLEYERCRKDEAENLGCREAVLDKLVESRRPKTREMNGLQGNAVQLKDVEPWPEPVNGAEVLDAIAEAFKRYVVLPDGAAEVCSLWCALAHVFEVFLCSPRLNVRSAEPECGKTTLRDVMGLFVPRPILTENLTVAVIFRLVNAQKPVLLADEYDAWMRDNEEMRGLLNAGHRRGAKVYRCEGDGNEVRAFNAYAPAMLCGIGSLPGTLHDRSIVVHLERKKDDEVCCLFHSEKTERELELCRKLARWCIDKREHFAAVKPNLPPGVFNRLADNWGPLLAIAEVAGGDWPRRCADACAKLTRREHEDAESIRTLLLVDIRKILTAEWPLPAEGEKPIPVERIFSKTLAEQLNAMAERPWPEARRGKPISEQWLAKQLANFRIHSKTLRIGEERAKGYEAGQFSNAFARYLPAEGVSTRDAVTYEGKPDFRAVTRNENVTGQKMASTYGNVTASRLKRGVSETGGSEDVSNELDTMPAGILEL